MEESRRGLDTDRREETANSLTTTIHSIFALKKEALDFTNQPLPGLDSGLLEEKFSLQLVKSDTSPRSVHTPHPIKAPDTSTRHMQTTPFPFPEASIVCPRTWPCCSHPLCSVLSIGPGPFLFLGNLDAAHHHTGVSSLPLEMLGSVVSPCVLFKSWQWLCPFPN